MGQLPGPRAQHRTDTKTHLEVGLWSHTTGDSSIPVLLVPRRSLLQPCPQLQAVPCCHQGVGNHLPLQKAPGEELSSPASELHRVVLPLFILNGEKKPDLNVAIPF